MTRNWKGMIAAVGAVALLGCSQGRAAPVAPDAPAPSVQEPQAPAPVQEPAAPRAQAAAPSGPGHPLIGLILSHGEEIDLTADQRERLESVQAEMESTAREAHERMREVMGEDARHRSAMRDATREQRAEMRAVMEEMRSVHRAAADEVREILTEEQREALRELRPHPRHGDRRHRMRHRPAGPGMMIPFALRHGDDIDLTPEQREQLESIATEMRAHREALRAEVEALRAEVESILTDEQIEELRSLAPRHGGRRGHGEHHGGGTGGR